MEFRPCIDLHDGKVKQIVGSTLKDDNNSAHINFESSNSPTHFANMYKADNIFGGHIIKLGPGNDAAAEEALKAWPNGMQIGGGINDKNAQKFIELGASKVIVTSFVFKDGKVNYKNLDKLVETVGKEKIVLDLSCKEKRGKYFIVTDRWQNFTGTEVNEDTLKKLSSYCSEFLVHAASVEGLKAGADLRLIKLLVDGSPIPVTYAGGIATEADIETVRDVGQNKINITIGSALDIFGGKLSYDKVVEICKK
jgi:phosphoribosylformimino-5-aminoimidazole carboxamide ribotide isomerase